MKQTPKLLCLLLAAILAFGLFAGCGNKDADASDPDVSGNVSPSPNMAAVYSEGLTDEGFFQGVRASDIVTLPDYIGLHIPAEITQASEEDVQEQIDVILQNFVIPGDPLDEQRPVEDGDTLNIDYVGSVDGVEFEGGSTNGLGTTVTIGVTSYIDDFLEQLIGHMPGETFDIEVTFPESYPSNPDLAGKDAVFNITINYISGPSTTPTELTDDIAQAYDFEDAEALKADIVDWLISNQKSQFFSELMSAAQVSQFPESVLDYVRKAELAYYESQAASYNMDLDSFFSSATGYENADAFLEANEEHFKQSATFYLACQALAELEDLRVSKSDIENQVNHEQVVSSMGEPYLKMYILQEVLCPDFVLENGVID